MQMRPLVVIGFLVALAAHVSVHASEDAHLNVQGTPLQPCSGAGMALTGFTRSGKCVTHDDDAGSHHICIDMIHGSPNFCHVTGQYDWCSSSMACDGDASRQCPVQHWCVCQWAFARYIEKAGGCDKIQKIVCEATEMHALKAYRAQAASNAQIAAALQCLESRCVQ